MINFLANCGLWAGLMAVPLFFTLGEDRYRKIFPKDWYVETPTSYWPYDPNNLPSPVGLSLGLLAVMVGQSFVLLYFYLRRRGYLGPMSAVQKEGARKYEWYEGLFTHLSQPEGFIILGGYLIGTWMSGLMPASYYSFAGGISITHLFAQLLVVDALQTMMHFLEHKVHPVLYQFSHKPHHRFTNPRLFDAFNGSFADTIFMILLPLYVTANVVPANVWTYMAFGSVYANWLTLIHSEFHHPWDKSLFRWIGFGTAGDHHVHHKLFIWNYGHLFTCVVRLLSLYVLAVEVCFIGIGIGCWARTSLPVSSTPSSPIATTASRPVTTHTPTVPIDFVTYEQCILMLTTHSPHTHCMRDSAVVRTVVSSLLCQDVWGTE